MELGVARFFYEPVLFPLQEDWCVGFLKEEEPKDLDQSIGHGRGIENPPPRSVLCHETSSNRSNGRSKQGRKTVDTDGSPTLLRQEQITQDTTTQRQRCRTSQPSQEAEDNHLGLRLGKTTAKVEEQVEKVAGLQNIDSAVHLREGP